MPVPSMALLAATGGGSWTPLSLPSLVGWWDASDAATITESAGAVSQWNDKSGVGNHLSQSTAAKKPTTGAATENGLNVLTFDGDNLRRTPVAAIGAAAVTWLAVCKRTGTDPSFVTWVLTLSSSNSGQPLDAYNQNAWIAVTGVSSPNFLDVKGTGADALGILGVQGVAGAGPGSHSIAQWWNGTLKHSVTTAGGVWATTSQKLVIGARDDEATTWRGEICEVLLCDAALGFTDRLAAEAYLRAKWNTP